MIQLHSTVRARSVVTFASVLAAVSAIALVAIIAPGPEARAQDPPGICLRTQEVQDLIIEEIEVALGVTRECGDVTDTDLGAIEGFLVFYGVTFKLGDMAGLVNLQELTLIAVGALPADFFNDLHSLTTLEIEDSGLQTLHANFINTPPADLSTVRFVNAGFFSLPDALFTNLTSLEDLEIEGTRLSAGQLTIIGGGDDLLTVRFVDVGLDGGDLTAFFAALPATNGLFNFAALDDDTSSWFGSATLTGDKAALAKAQSLTQFGLDITGFSWAQVYEIFESLPAGINALFLGSQTPIAGDFDASKLSGLSSLATLGLDGVGISAETAAQIIAALPGTFSGGLHLVNNAMGQVPTGGFGSLTALEVLVLSGNGISTLPSDTFSGMTALRFLNLSDNSITTIDLGVFSGLEGTLQSLDLRGNPLTQPPTLSDFTALGFASLSSLLTGDIASFPGAEIVGPTIYRIAPEITSVTLKAGEQVRLAVEVYGIQNILDNGLADNDNGVSFSWSDARGGTFSESTSFAGRQNGHHDDRQVLYTAPNSPGTTTVTAKLGVGNGCYAPEGDEAVEDDTVTPTRCTVNFEVTVRRASAGAPDAVAPVNPSGPIPSILTDSGGFAFSVFTPVEGGEFIGEGFGVSAGAGAVPNGEIIGIAMASAGGADNMGSTHQRYTLRGDAYAIGVVDSSGVSVSSYRLDSAAEVCVPMPDALRSNISDVSLVTVNGDGTLTILTSNVKLSSSGIDVCGAISSLPAIVAAGAAGAPEDFPTPMPEPEVVTPDTGGSAPTNSAVLFLLLLGLAIATVGVLTLRRVRS